MSLIVPFDPERHSRFVFSAWCHGAGEPRDRLHRLLRTGCRCWVRQAAGKPELFYGFVAVPQPPRQEVIWVYVKEEMQRFGLMVELLGHAGIDTTKQMTALFRSPACDGLRRRGWKIRYENEPREDT